MDDSRFTCLQCLHTLVRNTPDAQPLYDDVLRFYASMSMVPHPAPAASPRFEVCSLLARPLAAAPPTHNSCGSSPPLSSKPVVLPPFSACLKPEQQCWQWWVSQQWWCSVHVVP